MELDNSLNAPDNGEISTDESSLNAEKLPDPLEAAQEAAKQLDEAATLLKNVVNTLSSLEK
ncbi:MAG: hypothetical protein K6C05_03385 [Anaerovibrio sp.]|uniref:hypothetical protein n=1 Tax=Anaerovibrio sp. TaxID=1872532 RepID=UPI0025E479A2|nr:hypothetical protein [Anaerovibrio sp.]MCR5175875.1 hypothetical protein [Anaerovibrio sp.]